MSDFSNLLYCRLKTLSEVAESGKHVEDVPFLLLWLYIRWHGSSSAGKTASYNVSQLYSGAFLFLPSFFHF